MDDHSESAAVATRAARPRWGWLVLACGFVLAALLIDQRATDWLTAAPVQHWLTRLVGIPATLGPYLLLLAVLASFPNRGRLCAGFLVPVLVSTGLLHALKWTIGRARPLAGEGPFHFLPFAGVHPNDSFPSGHAMAAGVLALLLGIYFPRARWMFYALAGLIGLERIVTRWHYTSDVLAGYALAALVVSGCMRLLGPAFYQKELPARDSDVMGDSA
jgi:membrane-associated phospholipid phosphatase